MFTKAGQQEVVSHGDVRSELALSGGRHHGDHLLAGLDQVNHVYHKGFGVNGAKGAAVHAVAALDAFLLIDLADAVLVVGDGVHRAALLAGAFQMGDGVVGTGLGTFSAGLALGRIDVSAVAAHADCAEITGILAGLTHALLAVVRHHIGGDGTLLAGRVDDLNHVGGVFALGAFSLRQAHSLPDDLTLFINTAAVSRLGTRDNLIGNVVGLFL